ncbi:domain of Kin17 curved DNA-binding protein-domain-containing protein [Vararia minispora EC-137]|uniref:Domain of Kin17 curved DNA-binding protein-domain-containing protein n=1 Tax=Vararia minispora EC-137 TaxID=1314806 RepID=A0ACB8QLT2_9AGAM|nr:domain of Kin17 curved DNA-binding protein-domain-containing protein [Vararia minispora EC-137]
MPRAEVGTPKYIANKMKSKGLQRLRWYCQICEKQCRDENAFKMHSQSESHLRQMLVVGENAGRHIADFSSQFQSEFVALLSRRWGTKRVRANNVYQEYIQDKQHLHMNATRWVTLTEFVKHLGRTGVAHVDETEKGWFIAWIDNSPKALAKQEAALKKERLTVSDEQRERLLIEEQIERAREEAEAKGEGPSGAAGVQAAREEGLKRDEGGKLSISLGAGKPKVPAEVRPEAAGMKPGGFKANPLKRPNVFKMAAAKQKTDGGPAAGAKRKEPMTAAERLIQEDQERKRRRMEREAGSS